MPKAGFAQQDAGVLDGDELTPWAKERFINKVKEYASKGPDASQSPFGCIEPTERYPEIDRIDLNNEELYPHFHEVVLTNYRDIAKSFDAKGTFKFMPAFGDPVALAVALGAEVPSLNFPDEFLIFMFGLPLLAIKLGFTFPPELAAQLPQLPIVPEIPSIEIPSLPVIRPELGTPDLRSYISGPDIPNGWADFKLWQAKIPSLILGLVTKFPELLIGLLQFDFGAICEAAVSSELFGPAVDNATMQAATQKAMVEVTSECLLFSVVASSVGSSSGGIVGGLASGVGLQPPAGPAVTGFLPRDRVVRAAREMVGRKWSDDESKFKKGDYENLTYTTFVYPILAYPVTQPPFIDDEEEDDRITQRNVTSAYYAAKNASSCGLFVRGCYLRAGAKDKYFTHQLRPNGTIWDFIQLAKRKRAVIIPTSAEMPKLKRGDAILVERLDRQNSAHILIVTEDYPGGWGGTVKGIEGGQNDTGNKRSNGSFRPTAIKESTYTFRVSNGIPSASRVGEPARKLSYVFNADKIIEPIVESGSDGDYTAAQTDLIPDEYEAQFV